MNSVSLIALFMTGCGGGGDGNTPVTPSQQFTYGAILPTTTQLSTMRYGLPLYTLSGNTLPTTVDLTTSPAMPTPGDQGQVGSCTAWSTGYAVTSYMVDKVANLSGTSPNNQASPGDLYAKTLATYGGNCTSGSTVENAMNVLANVGVAGMAQSPYNTTTCVVPLSGSQFAITAWHEDSTLAAIKSDLASGVPVAFGCRIYDDLQSWTGPGIYTGDGNIVPNEGHSMTIVGYDDTRQAFRIMNSWTTAWGDGGYFWMAYTTFQTLFVDAVAAEGSQVNPTPPSSPATMTSMQALEYFDQAGDAYLVLEFTLSQPVFVTAAQAVDPLGQSTSGPVNQVLTSSYFWWEAVPPGTQWPQGAYQLSFVGTTASGQNVTLQGSATLTLGRGTRVPARAQSRATVSFAPGTKLIANGHPITVGATSSQNVAPVGGSTSVGTRSSSRTTNQHR